jgi:hypothetical protein
VLDHWVSSLNSLNIPWHLDIVIFDYSSKDNLEQIMRIESARTDVVIIAPSELSFICNKPSMVRLILLRAGLA